jgi:hypothetical protein
MSVASSTRFGSVGWNWTSLEYPPPNASPARQASSVGGSGNGSEADGCVVLVVVVLEVVELVDVDVDVEVDVDVLVVDVLVDVVVLVVVVVVVVGVSAVVTMSCGPLLCSRDLMSAPSEPLIFDTTNANVPLPLTALVTSNSTQVLAFRRGTVASCAPLGGAVFQVRPFSVQPVPVALTATPWLVPFDATRSRSLALETGPASPLVVNLTYDLTAALDECSTRSGSSWKFADARFCSTRASATAVKVTEAGAPPAGAGSATATALAATTTAARNERAHGARRGKPDKMAPWQRSDRPNGTGGRPRQFCELWTGSTTPSEFLPNCPFRPAVGGV